MVDIFGVPNPAARDFTNSLPWISVFRAICPPLLSRFTNLEYSRSLICLPARNA